MSFRDRFFTPTTARALLSWRIVVGLGAALALGVAGVPVALAVLGGLASYGALVLVAMPGSQVPAALDPFAVGEPWRRFVQSGQRAGARLRQTVDGVDDGPLRDRLESIRDRLDEALVESWAIARRGDELDAAIRELDTTGLRSKLEVLEARRTDPPTDEMTEAIAAVQSQLQTAERLRELSERAAGRLRLTEARVDELVARASEIALGTGDTDEYAHDVDELVVELEALRQAVEETRDP